jgi:hypothetical protein
MQFDKFSAATLRFAIEKELQAMEMPNVKMASVIALNRLKEDPEYYLNKYGFADPLEKARIVKYKRRWKGKDGKWEYEYYDTKQNNKIKTEKIKLKMRFDAHGLIHNYEYIGYSERVGNEKTSEKSLTKAEEFENNITDYTEEQVLVLDKNGNIIMNKFGDSEEINLEKEQKIIRYAEILTHTHPEDKSFSVEDVFLALSLGIKELRVKTPENTYFFKISHKEKSKDKYILSNKNRNFMNIIIHINDVATSYYRNKVKKKSITPEKAEKEHRKLVWESIVQSQILQEDFNIEYGKVKK